jgi:hypothetical protein
MHQPSFDLQKQIKGAIKSVLKRNKKFPFPSALVGDLAKIIADRVDDAITVEYRKNLIKAAEDRIINDTDVHNIIESQAEKIANLQKSVRYLSERVKTLESPKQAI